MGCPAVAGHLDVLLDRVSDAGLRSELKSHIDRLRRRRDFGFGSLNRTCRAVRDGGHFVVNGQKDLDLVRGCGRLLLLDLSHQRRRPAAPGRQRADRGDGHPGIEVRPITDMSGNRHFCEVFFADVRVPAENLVGFEGNAFAQTMAQLEHERGGIYRLVSKRPLFDRAVAAADTADPRGGSGCRRRTRQGDRLRTRLHDHGRHV